MTRIPSERELLSAVIAETLGDEVVTVGELADRVAQHGFGLLTIVVSLPALIPVLPPGVAVVVGVLYVVLAAQMLIGPERPWLPARVRRERFTRSRQLWIPDAILTRMVAVAVLLLGVVRFSPLPFFHTIPALTVMIPGFGSINRDALFRVSGFVLSVGTVAVAVLGAEKLVAQLQRITERIQ